MNVDFTGTWTADLAASTLRGPMPRQIVFSIAHAAPDLRAELTMTRMDGQSVHTVFVVRTTGEPAENDVLGTEWLSEARWAGPELLIESRVAQGGREVHFRDYWSLSSDGATLTMEHRDDDLAGQITILRRTHAR